MPRATPQTTKKQTESELKASEIRYRRLFESAKDGILLLDPDSGGIVDANPYLEELLGFTHEELLAKKLWEIGSVKDVAASQRAFQALQHDQYIRYEHLPLQTKDGRSIDVEFVNNSYAVDGRLVIQCNIRDITERKRTEQMILDANAYAESIVGTVREPLVILDQNLRVKTASRAFYQSFKVIPAETENQLLYNLGNGQWDIPSLRTLLEEILPQNNQFNDFEVERTFEGIGHRIMLLNARRIHLQDNQSELILLAIEDITARKENEARLEKTRKELEVIKTSADESLEYAESIINTVREPLIALDQDLRVVTASRSFYEVFKVNHAQTVGQLIYDLGNKQWDIPKLRELLEDILPQKAAFDNYEVEHDFSEIGQRIMLLNARQIQRGSGKERIILLAIEDITERKEIEAGLEKTRKELEVIKTSADESLEYAESIINTVREPLIALDQNLRVVTASRSFYEVFKVNHAQTVGQLIYDLGNKQWDIPKLRELLEDILPQKAAFDNYEVEHDFSEIGQRIMLLNARQIQRGSGKERIILLAIEDITERKEIEAGLEKTRKELEVIKASADESLEYAESIINTVREPLISLDQDLRVVTASRSFYEVFRVNPDETVGQLIYDLGNNQWDIPRLRTLLEEILPQNNQFNDFEVEHTFEGIGHRIMLLNARRIHLHKHQSELILLAIEDITERKLAEGALLLANAYNRSLIEASIDPLVTIGPDGRILDVNGATEKITGIPREELVGTDFSDYFTGPDQARAGYQQAFREGLVRDYPLELRRVDGHVTSVLYNASVYRNADGQVIGVLAAARDISERKRVEAELHAARQVVEAASRAKSEFLANMSHELRTPLNAIIGFSEVLQDNTFGPLNPKQSHYVGNVLTAGQHLLSLINDILDLSKIEAGKTTVEPISFALNPVLTNALVLVKERAMKSGLTLSMDVPSGLSAYADERMFKQVLFNLLSNAVKFTPPGGRIIIAAEQCEDGVCVSVTDSGIGIKAEDQQRLFAEFVQLDSGYDRMHQGTGLGLALTRKFVELHGGRVWVESPGEGLGSTFRFTLPAANRDGFSHLPTSEAIA